MICRFSSARNRNRLPLSLKDIVRLHCLSWNRNIFGIALMLWGSCISVVSQNTAALTIGGVMPSIQRLSINAVHVSSATNQTVVTLDATSNADGRYSVTIQPKSLGTLSNGDNTVYQIKCEGHSFTLTPRTSEILSEYVDNKSSNTMLQISNPSASGDHILTLTVVSQ